AGLGPTFDLTAPVVQSMPPQMYQWLVLAADPLDYRGLANLNAVEFGNQSIDDEHAGVANSAHYAIVFPTKENASLPRGLLHWTTFAFVVWDDYDPAKLAPDEQAALVDWLHWGGQLILSGPDTLNTLADSFLKPYLPATAGESITLDREQLAFLEQPAWRVRDKSLQVVKPWSGVELVPHATAQRLLDSPHIVERRVGRGRVVATAFRLDQRELREWPGYDGFWHTCLLRRVPRRFESRRNDDEGPRIAWATGHPQESALSTDVRLFARDAGRDVPLPTANDQQGVNAVPVPLAGSSMGAWSDQSALQTAASKTISEAAGIIVPERAFVTRLLGLYLALLVPANWLLFRLFNRVEWAWFAVPVIAVTFAGVVTWLAQVNIGFARSQTEIAVVELQANHPRAHVTRFMALYSSLGTAYDIRTLGVDSLALPFTNKSSLDSQPLYDLHLSSTTMPQGDTEVPAVRMTGFEVDSNSSGMLHIEQVLNFGSIECVVSNSAEDTYEVTNHTGRDLTGFLLGPNGVAWYGELAHQASVTCHLAARPDDFERARNTPAVSGVNLQPLIDLAMKNEHRSRLRFIGWCDAQLPGVAITPYAAQQRVATLVVANLEYGVFPELAFDQNYQPTLPKRGEPVLEP
ncbi:MAG: hypothetical protein JNM18_21675, partial [Planctomycetaceae bacterium]|nr:hypothetical protein [Planctomycetaceae bacterium]